MKAYLHAHCRVLIGDTEQEQFTGEWISHKSVIGALQQSLEHEKTPHLITTSTTCTSSVQALAMAMTSSAALSLLQQLRPSFAISQQYGILKSQRLSLATRATVTPYLESVDSEPSKEEASTKEELLCCPICFQPLCRDGPKGLTLDAIKRSRFSCTRCTKRYANKDVYLDLTLMGEGSEVYEETTTLGTELFRNPLVSFVYERGWRASFIVSNFPGPDAEFKMAQDYFKAAAGGVLIDVSCGSGLFARRFAQSGVYSSVIASDFSENMLKQTNQFITDDASLATSNIALVRADVGRLPFATGSIDAVHAGAALHCWPSPLSGMAEISRILKPGGIFVGTTVVDPIPLPGDINIRKAIKRAFTTTPLRYWEESELRELCGICGLVEYTQVRERGFIMISAKKATH